MTDPLMIENWACKIYPDGGRSVTRQDGRGVTLYPTGALGGSGCYVPPAVLAWLIKPLMTKEKP